MAQLRINGKSTKDLNQRATVLDFGYTLILLIEAAWSAGRLESQAAKMKTWLEQNPDHPKRPGREQRYWSVALERNQATSAVTDRAADLSRLHRRLTDETLEEMAEVYGAHVPADIGKQIAVIARREEGLRIFSVLGKWVMDRADQQDGVA